MTRVGFVIPRRPILIALVAGAMLSAGAVNASGATITLVPQCAPVPASSTVTPTYGPCTNPWTNARRYFRWLATVDGVVHPVVPGGPLAAAPAPGLNNRQRWCAGLNEAVPATLVREGNMVELCRVVWDVPLPDVDPAQFEPVSGFNSAPALRQDTIAPTLVGTMRAPDSNGWYNRPVVVSWNEANGSTVVPVSSPVPSPCGTTTYSGPDSVAATVSSGSVRCTDQAGNVSIVPASVVVKYDTTPTTLEATATPTPTVIIVQWKAGPDVATIAVTRVDNMGSGTPTPIYTGLLGNEVIDQKVVHGTLYTYRITATDPAGNVTERVLTTKLGDPPVTVGTPTPTPPVTVKSLMTPPNGKVFTAPPVLRWPAVAGAKYYNVQLYVRGRKVMSTWPSGTRFQVPNSWRFNRTKYRARTQGKIRWYVWPAVGGTVAKPKFGPLIGTSTFTIKKK